MALSPEERTWAAVAHLAPLVGYFLLIGQVLLPLAILFLGPNTLYGLGLFLLALTVVGLVVVYPLALALLALVLWNMVRGALAAGRGEVYRYAFILRLVP